MHGSHTPKFAVRIGKLVSSATCLLVVAGSAAVAAPAEAASAPAVSPAATIALHGLGAKPPTRHIAAQNLRSGMGALAVLPASVDLRAYAMPVGNQGNVGSCVTWAINYGLLGWYSKKSGRVGQPFAPMYTYSQINGGGDNGSSPTAALGIALTQGTDTKAHYSHDDFDWWDQPTNAEKANAAHWKISAYHTLFSGAQAGSATALKTALSTGHPVAITIPVRHGFDYMGSTTTSVDSDYTSAIRGWHEILAVGYDASGLIVQNSWGTYWGARGFGKLSWAVVAHDVVEGNDIDGFAPDTATPVMLTAKATANTSGVITTATVPYSISWTALGSITNYHVSFSANGGAPVPVTLSNAKATSYTFNATPGTTYTFSIYGTDALAQASNTITTSSFTPNVVQENDASLVYSGPWTHPAAATASGGAEQLTVRANASATITTTARTIGWIASRATGRGSAKVYVDGALKATISLYSTAAQSKLIAYSFDFGSSGSHTMQIVAVGTVGHPGVDVDAFVVTT